MLFDERFRISDDKIEMFRGTFRGVGYYEPCFENTPEVVKNVYVLMQTVYNIGEHDGRDYVRRKVKKALNIELI